MMLMKKIIEVLGSRALVLSLLFLFAVSSGFAQKNSARKSPEEMRKEMREFKLKFLAQEIELRDDQQKDFIETYDQLMDERTLLFDNTRKIEKKIRREKNVTEADYEALNKAKTEAKEKDAQIEKKYDEKFSKFLTGKQLFKLKNAEEKFRKKIIEMHHSKKHKGNKGNSIGKSKSKEQRE